MVACIGPISERTGSFAPICKKILVVAGTGTKGYSGDGGPAKAAQLNAPHEVRFDRKGDLYVVERDNAIVRRVVPASCRVRARSNGLHR